MEGSQKSDAAKELVATINGWQNDQAYKALFSKLV